MLLLMNNTLHTYKTRHILYIYVHVSAYAHRHTHTKRMQRRVRLLLRECDSCAIWGFVAYGRVRQGDVPNTFFGLSEVRDQLASTGTSHQTLSTSCLSVSRLSLWNVYDSGAVDKMEIDLDWKANKIAKAQSQLKSRQREQRGERKRE